MRKLSLVASTIVLVNALAACRTANSNDSLAKGSEAAAPDGCPAQVAAGVSTLDDLKKLPKDCLKSLFASGRADPSLIPSSATPGVSVKGFGLPILITGGVLGSSLINGLANELWSGKIFTTENGKTSLVNDLGVTGIADVSADVTYIEKSLTRDGKPSILLDYGKSNRISARPIRDEIRLVGPGLYLGVASFKNHDAYVALTGELVTPVLFFALKFEDAPK